MNHYSFFGKILHDIILGNKFVSASLFEIEKIIFLKKKLINNNKHIFITSLPRSGTTIILNLIYSSNHFSSLKYSNMPFLLAPNLSKFFNKKKIETRERLHGDKITFNLDSPEAFDEYYFSKFIDHKKDNENKDLLDYINLILISQNKSRYLSKNNSNYKRINLIKSIFPNSYFLILVRDPLQHAFSIYRQHKNFTELQKKDDFVRRYMNYLGHNEFGINHKYWNPPINYDDESDLNYWIEQWNLFYKKIYKDYKNDQNCIFLSYEKLSDKNYISKILNKLEVTGANLDILKNIETRKIDLNYDQKILNESNQIYESLTSITF